MYKIGFGKRDITAARKGYAMQGYGMWFHCQEGVSSPLYARVFYFEDEAGTAAAYACLDLGYITNAIRSGVEAEMAKQYPGLDPQAVVISCTHTHSAPGGCAHEPLYNLVTPGFQPDVVEEIVKGTMAALKEAIDSAETSELSISVKPFADDVPVAWNRSLSAYNLNSDVTKYNDNQCHLAVNRNMQLLTVKRAGSVAALLSWFGVHATALSNKLRKVDGDNKGYAAQITEEALPDNGVAIFAQGATGDISTHYHGPDQWANRKAIKGEAEYEYARQNGHYQSQHALQMAKEEPMFDVSGSIDYELIYVDFSDIHVDPDFANGKTDAYTADPCHGVSFFTGTPVDGPGMPPFVGRLAGALTRFVKNKRLKNLAKFPPAEQEHYRRIYDAHGVKNVLLESGKTQHRAVGLPFDHPLVPSFVDPTVAELKRQYKAGAIQEHGLVPYVLPIQILILGNVAVIACPGEFTTTAGQRMVETTRPILQHRGVKEIIFATYCNEYMGYVTTYEEYQAQRYEGGHTVFGQYSLGAFQTQLRKLATEMLKPKEDRLLDYSVKPPAYSREELALRSSLPPRKKVKENLKGEGQGKKVQA